MNRASSPTGWVRNPDGTLGWIWNPLTGCENHTSEGLCLDGMFPCYAWKVANGRLKTLYLANDNIAPLSRISEKRVYRLATERGIVSKDEALADPFYPRFWPERIDKARLELANAKPRGIFPCDMGELFGDWVPKEWQEEVFDLFREFPQHRFYTLTKQPQNLPKFNFPENCWVGVTATDASMAWIASKHLSQIEAKVKFLSIEPLLSWETSTPYTTENIVAGLNGSLDWVIIGACTGTLSELKPLALKYPELSLMPYGVRDPGLPSTRGKKWTLQPRIEWVEEIVRARDKAGVKVFLKDNLLPMFQAEWSKKFDKEIWDGERLRQELPQEAT